MAAPGRPRAMGTRIRVLDPVVANQIAAGEVVERPASVVKELVENSIDAGATRVEVTVEDGGRQLIRVRDNGCGMSEEDAILCLQRHATSKIRDADDLHRLVTLGFRGEALPSIASVSQFVLRTRTAEQTAGIEVGVEAGRVESVEAVGCPVGCDITVRNLFFNVPARLKFLRSSSNEMDHITRCLTAYALLHPEVAFRLDHNGRSVLSSPACGSLADAVVTVYGAELARGLVPIALEAGDIQIAGLVGKPAVTRGTRSHQWLFCNGRPIVSRVLTGGVYDAYHTLLMAGRHPVFVVRIELDPAAVDVNVHPNKSEVRFAREWELRSLLRGAVREALEASDLLTTDGVDALAPGRPAGPGPSGPNPLPDYRQTSLFEEAGTTAPAEDGRLPAHIEPLGQVADSYIVCDTDEGMLIIDQHALHERVLYEQLAQADAERGVERQLLAVPVTLHLSPREVQAADEHRETLHQLGFELEPFGGDTYRLRAVPAMLGHRRAERILRDVLDDLVAQQAPRSLEQHRDLVLRTMACKAAVKAGDPLAAEEIRELVRLARACQLPYHCNHGRPTMFTIPVASLEKRFERT